MSEAHVDARRARLLEHLRSTAYPLTAQQLTDALPDEQPRWADRPARPSVGNVYANLRQLERAGLARRVKIDPARGTYWYAMVNVAERITFDALVATLTGASDGER